MCSKLPYIATHLLVDFLPPKLTFYSYLFSVFQFVCLLVHLDEWQARELITDEVDLSVTDGRIDGHDIFAHFNKAMKQHCEMENGKLLLTTTIMLCKNALEKNRQLKLSSFFP